METRAQREERLRQASIARAKGNNVGLVEDGYLSNLSNMLRGISSSNETNVVPAKNMPSLSQFNDPNAVSPTQYNTPAKNKTSIFDDYEGLNVAQGIGRGLGQTFDAAKDTVLGANKQAVKLLNLPQDMGTALNSDIQFGKDIVSGFTGSNTSVPDLPIPAGRVPGNRVQPVFPSAFMEDSNDMGVVPLLEGDTSKTSDKVVPQLKDDTSKTKTTVSNQALTSTTLPAAVKSGEIVPTKVETPTEVAAKVKEEFEKAKLDATETGTDDSSGVNLKTFKATDGEGKEIPVPPEQVKGIFDKASEQFGDIFSASDLKRMTLYTLGGLMTGGSFAGSFQWAGMKVMQEQEVSKANQEAKDAKTLDYERLVARELTALDAQQLATLTRAEFDKIAAKALSDTRITEAEVKALADLEWRNLKLKLDQENSIRTAEATLAAAKIKAGANNVTTKTGERYRYVVTGGKFDGKNIPIVEYKTPNGNEWIADTPLGPMTVSDLESLMANKSSPYYGNVHRFGKSDTPKAKNEAMTAFINGGVKDNIRDTWKSYDLDPNTSTKLHSSIMPYMKRKGYNIYDSDVQMQLNNVITLAADNAARDQKFNNTPVDNLGPYVTKMLISTAINAPDKGAWHISGSANKSVDPSIIEKFSDQMMRDSNNDFKKVKESFKGYYESFLAARKNKTLKDEKLLDGENQFSVYLRKKLAE